MRIKHLRSHRLSGHSDTKWEGEGERGEGAGRGGGRGGERRGGGERGEKEGGKGEYEGGRGKEGERGRAGGGRGGGWRGRDGERERGALPKVTDIQDFFSEKTDPVVRDPHIFISYLVQERPDLAACFRKISE